MTNQRPTDQAVPVPENVLLLWADNLNPERAHMCPEFIYNIRKEKSDD